MKARLDLGDVFAVPLDATRAGIGQVVATYGQGAFYFAIFDLLVHPDAAEASIDEALAADVLFLAPSLDARLPVPYLTMIGSRPVRPGLPLPAHREVARDSTVQVVDFSGRRRRPATEDEARRLQNRRFVAPLRLAHALRATAGLEPWDDAYVSLIPDDELSSDRLFGPEPGIARSGRPDPWAPRDPTPRSGSVRTTTTLRTGAVPTGDPAPARSGPAPARTGAVPTTTGGRLAVPRAGAVPTIPSPARALPQSGPLPAAVKAGAPTAAVPVAASVAASAASTVGAGPFLPTTGEVKTPVRGTVRVIPAVVVPMVAPQPSGA